jgi:hypothetical protein
MWEWNAFFNTHEVCICEHNKTLQICSHKPTGKIKYIFFNHNFQSNDSFAIAAC